MKTDEKIIKEIEKKPLTRYEFSIRYDIDVATAHRLFPKYLCLCKDGVIRVQKTNK